MDVDHNNRRNQRDPDSYEREVLLLVSIAN
jgi:hypothetical protein